MMGWQPKPSDIRSAWQMQWEFALIAIETGMADGPELVLVHRVAGDPSWSSVGASDGSVYMSSVSFEQAVAADGGFLAWLQPILAEINARLAAKCAVLKPGAVPLTLDVVPGGSAPATFADFQAWLVRAARWSNAGAVDPPGPQPGVRDSWGKRSFQEGYATEVGLRFHADGRIERIERIMIQNVGWQPLPRA